MPRVAVFGASGVQGAAQINALVEAGHDPIAISRSPKALEINGINVKTAAANFSDSPAIKAALSDAEVVFLNLPSTSFQPAEPILAGAQLIADAIKATPSIKLTVFNTSMPVPETKRGIKAQDDRVEIRSILRSSGLPVISIQPVVYLDNLFEGWAYIPIAERQTIVYCHKPTLEVSWISHHNVAQLMISAMARPHLAGRNIPVGGPEIVTLEQLTAKLAAAWGRQMRYENQTVDDFCEKMGVAMKKRAGLDAEKVISQMHKAYTFYNESEERPFRIDMKPVLEELPAELMTIEEWGMSTKHKLPPPVEAR